MNKLSFYKGYMEKDAGTLGAVLVPGTIGAGIGAYKAPEGKKGRGAAGAGTGAAVGNLGGQFLGGLAGRMLGSPMLGQVVGGVGGSIYGGRKGYELALGDEEDGDDEKDNRASELKKKSSLAEDLYEHYLEKSAAIGVGGGLKVPVLRSLAAGGVGALAADEGKKLRGAGGAATGAAVGSLAGQIPGAIMQKALKKKLSGALLKRIGSAIGMVGGGKAGYDLATRDY